MHPYGVTAGASFVDGFVESPKNSTIITRFENGVVQTVVVSGAYSLADVASRIKFGELLRNTPNLYRNMSNPFRGGIGFTLDFKPKKSVTLGTGLGGFRNPFQVLRKPGMRKGTERLQLRKPNPQSGHEIVAEISHGDQLDYHLEASKPSLNQKHIQYHYLENDGRHDPNGGILNYDQTKSVLPGNYIELFKNSIEYKGTRYAMDSNGAIHQFQDSANGVFHWAGSQAGKTLSGKLIGLDVPTDVVKYFRGIK